MATGGRSCRGRQTGFYKQLTREHIVDEDNRESLLAYGDMNVFVVERLVERKKIKVFHGQSYKLVSSLRQWIAKFLIT